MRFFRRADHTRRSERPPDEQRTEALEAPGGRPEAQGPEPESWRADAPVLAPPPTVVPRWVQLVVLPVALLALWALARASGPVLLVALFAAIVALILNPVVKLLERRRIPRGLAIALVYLSGLAALGGLGWLLSNPISNQVNHFQRDVPHLVRQANRELASVQRWLDRNGINVHLQKQGQTALQTIQKDVLKRSGAIVSFSRDLLAKIVTVSFALVLVLVLSIYMLVYAAPIGDLVRRMVPPGDGTPEDDFPLLIQRAVFDYVRGQLLFSLIMGASAAAALWVFGATGIFPDGSTYAVFFGGFYGLMELIPYVGPIVGPVPAVLVALFNHPLTALWVVLLFVALQQLEGHLVAPQVFRLSLRINPILIILALLVGGQIYGVPGALLALPIASILRETIEYLRRHLVLERWNVIVPGGPPRAVGELDPDVCPECGTLPAGEDAFCRRCGASLTPRVGTRT